MDDLVVVENITKHFPVRGGMFRQAKGVVHAVDNVSLSIKKGETLGLVGESGCGKSTLGRIIARLIAPTSGKVFFESRDITNFGGKDFGPIRKNIQVVFQDPYASLNPRMPVGQIIGEALAIHKIVKGRENIEEVKKLLGIVGLSGDAVSRYPHEFSGGQRQRIGIARALSLNPKLIIADEPVSALDVSIQAQILNLLNELQSEFGLTYLFIAHDLRVVEYISDRVVVMYLGKIVEVASSKDIYKSPLHPYTEALLSAIPMLNLNEKKKRIRLKEDVPSPINPPSGCRFHTRCISAKQKCGKEEPQLINKNGRFYACHYPLKPNNAISIICPRG